MGPSPATIPRFLLPQLSWKASSPSPLAVASRIHPPTKGSAPRNKPTRFVSSIARRYKHNQYNFSPLVSNRQGPPLARYSYVPHNHPQCFSTTPTRFRDHHFDTLKFVQRLKDEGFSEEQSKAMMLVLSDVIEESIQNLTRTMVLREDADRSTYTQKVDFTKLRSELLALDSSDTSMTLASHERLSNDLAKLSSRLRDEVNRAQASVRLDLNLEKGRIREEAKGQELKIKETETRIEQEVAGLRERVEGVKFSTLQWLMGVCTGTAALILGAWRLLM
ncbi:hypothetical protein HO133_008782 [Letharia lupina]|uniref:DUF1640-domain-containing protein n=1 Tax=Letharia lupina TaxID=560253 RepID=A0A8H6CPR5_9LECA|nr:uncharacterized protein HO133_008782 [Letharia lupina]KAF6227338.1 hypothetical protein HO133_008782 [Letharia lupina]